MAALRVGLRRNVASPELKCELRARPGPMASEDTASSSSAHISAVGTEEGGVMEEEEVVAAAAAVVEGLTSAGL